MYSDSKQLRRVALLQQGTLHNWQWSFFLELDRFRLVDRDWKEPPLLFLEDFKECRLLGNVREVFRFGEERQLPIPKSSVSEEMADVFAFAQSQENAEGDWTILDDELCAVPGLFAAPGNDQVAYLRRNIKKVSD